MSWVIDLVMRSALGRGALAVLSLLVAGMLWLSRRDRKRDSQRRIGDVLARARAAAATRERMDNADIGTGDRDDDARWLLERGQRTRREPPLVRRH